MMTTRTVLLFLFVFLWYGTFLIIDAQHQEEEDEEDDDDRYTVMPPENCAQPPGCSFDSTDIIFDEETRQALEVLRNQTKSNEPVELEPALMISGNANHSTLTLMGKSEYETNAYSSDRGVIHSPLVVFPDNGSIEDSSDKSKRFTNEDFLFNAVFDGGDMEDMAEYASMELPRILAEKLGALDGNYNDPKVIHKLIKESFFHVDEQGPGDEAGSSISMVLQVQNTIYLAHVGDASSSLGIHIAGTAAVMVTTIKSKHYPLNPEEKKRLQDAGARVTLDEQGMPVVSASTSTREIFVSRGLGYNDIPGVTADPTIRTFPLDKVVKEALKTFRKKHCEAPDDCSKYTEKDVNLFAFSASDGLAEYKQDGQLEMDDMAIFYASSFFAEGNPHPHTTSEYLLLQAANYFSSEDDDFRDDMTVAASRLQYRW